MKKLTDEQKQVWKGRLKTAGKGVLFGGVLYGTYQLGATAGIGEALWYIVEKGEVELTETRSGKRHLFTATEIVKEIVE